MRSLFLYIVLIFIPFTMLAQVGADSSDGDDSYNFLLASIGYTSNSDGSRNANAIKMPALVSTLSYYHNRGIWTSANLFKYQGTAEFTYDAELQLGYQKSFMKNFDISVYYTNRHFSGENAYTGIDYNHSFTANGTGRLSNFSLDLDYEYMIGKTNNYFLDISLSYDYSIEKILSSEDYLIFSPTIIGSSGTTYWISDAMGHVWGDHGGGHHMGGYEPDNNFDYQRISLILPVMYTLGSFTISGGWFYSIPSEFLKEQNWSNQSGFLVSLIYSAIF